CNPTSSKFIHTWLRFGEIMRGSLSAEHWIVVAGTAQVTINEQTKLLGENESIYIPVGATHCLENPGKIPLELIEVRSGSYLGEDDIVRFADRYGRV
ncbi:cupin domain-containing protein, partial [Enterobacter asburiae]|uniref:cupin domain-containing protein n=1 Tax=Enterobacter asburiae TaxID=61645 RepID=UPI00292BD30D